MTHVHIRFRFRLGPSIRTHTSMRIYGKKYSALMRAALSTKLSQVDYDDLPKLRTIVDQYSIADLADVLLKHAKPEMRKMLLDCTPIFNGAPRDLKAFLILVSGIRSHHVQGEAQ